MHHLPFPVNIFIVLLVIWSLAWKVYAVWIACKNNHKKWFVALVILNTASILEIFYVLKIAKKSWAEVKADFRRVWNSIGK